MIIENVFNQVLCGFRKAHSTSPFQNLQKYQKGFDSARFIGTILMDLSL